MSENGMRPAPGWPSSAEAPAPSPPHALPPAPMPRQQGPMPPVVFPRPAPPKRRAHREWLNCAVVTMLLLFIPHVVTFLIDLRPGDHSDNGDGLYVIPGLLLVPCLLSGHLMAVLTLIIGVVEWFGWVRAGYRRRAVSVRMIVALPVALLAGVLFLVLYWHLPPNI